MIFPIYLSHLTVYDLTIVSIFELNNAQCSSNNNNNENNNGSNYRALVVKKVCNCTFCIAKALGFF